MSITQRSFSSLSPYHRLSSRNSNQTPVFQRRRSNSINNCIIEKKRGFKPSDRFDPVKKDFLVKLSRKFWCRVRTSSFKSLLIVSN